MRIFIDKENIVKCRTFQFANNCKFKDFKLYIEELLSVWTLKRRPEANQLFDEGSINHYFPKQGLNSKVSRRIFLKED